MNARPFPAVAGSLRIEKAAILYDQFEIFLTAKEWMDRVPMWAGEPVEWKVNSWRFDLLRLGSRFEAWRALEESADVRLIVVTFRKVGDSANELVNWLVHWTALRQRTDAQLIVMPFGPEGGAMETASLCGDLRRLAGVRSLSFSVVGIESWRQDVPGMRPVYAGPAGMECEAQA